MKSTATLQLALRHLLRSPGKLLALVLLLGCNLLALHTGMQELHARRERIATIEEDRRKAHDEVFTWFAEGKKGPEDRPWVDISDPFWASWHARPKAVLAPSPLLAIAPGRIADNPWFADLTYFSNAYSTRMSTEISDPEHRQLGTFEWTFVLVYLMPLVLLALVFDVGGAERDRGAWTLIRSHAGSMRVWLAWRFVIPVLAVWTLTLLPMLFTASRAGAFAEHAQAAWAIVLLATVYILFWSVLLWLAAWMASGCNDQALRGAIAYAAICLVLPGALQWAVKLQHPPSLMLGYITADRVGAQAVYELERDTIVRRFYTLHPELSDTPHGRDTVPNEDIDWLMGSNLVSAMMDSVVGGIVAEEQARLSAMDRSTLWLPSAAIPLVMERLAGTDAASFLGFRMDVQRRAQAILRRITEDSWNKRRMDEEGFREYAGGL
ncbi:MAG: DUF3526 domain-containing protein [Flavobacteriales bacterium]